jgi:hypothetical protein
LDLSSCFPGTLNIDIRPLAFELIKPEFTFRDVNWTDLHPPETFSFSACSVTFAGIRTEGWIYYPHPETKERNFHDPSLLEVIVPRIPGLKIGDQLLLHVKPARVLLKQAGEFWRASGLRTGGCTGRPLDLSTFKILPGFNCPCPVSKRGQCQLCALSARVACLAVNIHDPRLSLPPRLGSASLVSFDPQTPRAEGRGLIRHNAPDHR